MEANTAERGKRIVCSYNLFSTEKPCDTKSNLMLSQAKQDSIETLFGYRWGETGYISLYMALDDDASTPKKEKERFELNISN